jgi:hypothetical protein
MSRFFPLIVLSASAQTPPTDPCVQNQVRLSLTGARDGSEMGVSWATSNATTPQSYSAVVRYGPASGPGAGRLTMTTKAADSRSYSVCGAASPFLHYTTMTGLQAGMSYYCTFLTPLSPPPPPTCALTSALTCRLD